MTTNRELIRAFLIFLVSFFSLMAFAIVVFALVSSGLTAVWLFFGRSPAA